MLLHAFFLAAVQVLVYAGAVMVLFLFVIMLLDLKEEEQRKIKGWARVCWAWWRLAVIALVMIRTIRQSNVGFGLSPPSAGRLDLGFGQAAVHAICAAV